MVFGTIINILNSLHLCEMKDYIIKTYNKNSVFSNLCVIS